MCNIALVPACVHSFHLIPDCYHSFAHPQSPGCLLFSLEARIVGWLVAEWPQPTGFDESRSALLPATQPCVIQGCPVLPMTLCSTSPHPPGANLGPSETWVRALAWTNTARPNSQSVLTVSCNMKTVQYLLFPVLQNCNVMEAFSSLFPKLFTLLFLVLKIVSPLFIYSLMIFSPPPPRVPCSRDVFHTSSPRRFSPAGIWKDTQVFDSPFDPP